MYVFFFFSGYLFSLQHEADYFVLEATGQIYLKVDCEADK